MNLLNIWRHLTQGYKFDYNGNFLKIGYKVKLASNDFLIFYISDWFLGSAELSDQRGLHVGYYNSGFLIKVD